VGPISGRPLTPVRLSVRHFVPTQDRVDCSRARIMPRLETSPGLNVVIKMHMVSCRHVVVPRRWLNETERKRGETETKREREREREREGEGRGGGGSPRSRFKGGSGRCVSRSPVSSSSPLSSAPPSNTTSRITSEKYYNASAWPPLFVLARERSPASRGCKRSR